jgi:hypothetical protein
MNYWDGQEARIGDKVRLGDEVNGVVVCSIDRSEYEGEHSEAQWGYLGKGVMIQFEKYGLIHYAEADEDLVLLGRASASNTS